VVDIATHAEFGPAVALADAALRRTKHPLTGVPKTAVSIDELNRELAKVPLRHGSVRARRTVEFADGRADRPGESLSRVTIARAGLTAPLLQVLLIGASGARYFADFWWPQFCVIGEFDGAIKYRDPEFLRGRTREQAFSDEKFREDDLRATGKVFARWGWSEANSAELLRSRLSAAGVR